MLVLSRKLNEEVIIDERIRVRIVGLQAGRVRIGIAAPEDVSIQRRELVDREHTAGEASAERALCAAT